MHRYARLERDLAVRTVAVAQPEEAGRQPGQRTVVGPLGEPDGDITVRAVVADGERGDRLANEMGLYSDDRARMGMLSFDALRAARLVVDTGIHAAGWSRERAIEHLWQNTAAPMGMIVKEVDRYINWPGQALAYLTGRLEIDALRETSRARMGDRFDLTAFHDTLLGAGSIPLSELRVTLDRWSASPATPGAGSR